MDQNPGGQNPQPVTPMDGQNPIQPVSAPTVAPVQTYQQPQTPLPMQNQYPANNTQYMPPVKQGSPFLTIILIIVLFALIGGVGFLGYTLYQDLNKKNTVETGTDNTRQSDSNEDRSNTENREDNVSKDDEDKKNDSSNDDKDSKKDDNSGSVTSSEVPKDVPIFQNSSELSVLKDDTNLTITYIVKSSVEDVKSFYLSELPKNGWQKGRESDLFGMGYTVIFTKSQQELSIVLYEYEGEISVIMNIE